LGLANNSILGVKVTSEKRDFHLIRTELAKETGNKDVTVPTLKVGGEYITDSWVIAEWVSDGFGSAIAAVSGTIFCGYACGS